MSRVPTSIPSVPVPMVDPGPPGSVWRATLWLALAMTLSPLAVGLFFVHGATVRWLRAIRGVERPGPQMKRAATVFLVMAFAPLACIATASASGVGGRLGALVASELPALGSSGLGALLVPLAVALVLVPALIRAPLVLVSDRPEDRGLTLLAGLERSLGLAAVSPLVTWTLTGAFAILTSLALAIGRTIGELYGVLASVALLPVLWTPVMMLVSGHTAHETPAPRLVTLGVLASFLAPGLLALGLVGAAATLEPLPLNVLTEGRGVQSERGMMRSLGERGQLAEEHFVVRGEGGQLVIEPTEGEPYVVRAEYDPALALFGSGPCSASLGSPLGLDFVQADCIEIWLQGPDWRMSVELDEHGHRLDDGPLLRSYQRVGVPGTLGILVGLLAIALTWLLLARTARRVRKLSGGGLRHRLAGKLRLGDGGALEGAALVGTRNLVEVLEGSVVLRLPERLEPLAIEQRTRSALDGCEVTVSMNAAPSFATHRSADAPWPEGASLVIGSPSAIESEALTSAAGTITRLVVAALAVSALALAAMSLS